MGGTGPTGALPAAASTRWSRQRSLFDRRQPAFWLFVVLLVFTGLSVLTDQLVFLEAFPSGWIFSIVLLALYVLPVAIAIYVLDLYEREPLSLMVAAFLWGGVISIGLAGPINTAWIEILAKVGGVDFAREWGAALVAPPVEETLKLLGVVTIFLIARDEIDDIIDGFVYGAMAGLGFAAVENVQYFIVAIARAGGADQIGPVIELFLLRVVFAGPYMHVLWSGIAGAGFAYFVTQRQLPYNDRLLRFVGLFLLAIAAHVVWNSPLLGDLVGAGPIGWLIYGLVKGSPFFIFLFLIVRLAHRREQQWFTAATAEHLGDDVLTQADLAQLGGLRSRWRARREVAARKGPAAGKLQGQIQRAQVKLALIRSRVTSDGDTEVVAHVETIRTLKAQLAAMPDVVVPAPTLPAQPAAPAAPAAAGTPAPTPTPAQAPTAPQAQPAPPPPTPSVAWQPTHSVPAQGMAAWRSPDGTQPPITNIPGGVQLRVVETNGAWARVAADNGWTGWVDGRLLVALAS